MILGVARCARRGPAVPATSFADLNLNAQALFTVGAAGYGAAEYGEFATAVAGVHAAGDSYYSFYRVFRDLGRLASLFGHDALSRGNRAAARGAFLRAASYLANPLYVAVGTSHPRQAAAYRAMNDAWVRAAGLLEPAAELVQFSAPAGPACRAEAAPPARGRTVGARRPTIIFNNGHEAQLIGLYVYGAAEAVALGYNALLFEGPGQGSMLFRARHRFRPDWEAVITPVVDYLAGLAGDVDPCRIALVGWSQGGALAARAAAFEYRLAALVELDLGVPDPMAAFHLPEPLVSLAQTEPAEADRAWAKIFAPAARQGPGSASPRPATRSASRHSPRWSGRWPPAARRPTCRRSPHRCWSPSTRARPRSRARVPRRCGCPAARPRCTSSPRRPGASSTTPRWRRSGVTRCCSTGWTGPCNPVKATAKTSIKHRN